MENDIRNKVGRLEITQKNFNEAFHLPNDTKIIRCFINIYNNIEIVMQHKDLKSVKDGQKIPEVKPIFQKEIISFDWNPL